MSAKTVAPAEEVRQWPLIVCLVLLAVGAVLNQRLGHTTAAIVLASLAVVILMLGFGLRARLGTPVAPRIRRVYVAEDPCSIRAVKLESAQYIAAPRRTSPTSPSAAASKAEDWPELPSFDPPQEPDIEESEEQTEW